MAVKKIGISRELIIHPGETIADVLEDRGITQAELAARTGVSTAYVSNVIAGKKDISANFAFSLEYALGVPKSFWLNLQANYDAELLEFNKEQSITEEERSARESLKDIVKYLRQKGRLPIGEKKDESILSLRKELQISNLACLKDIVPNGAFRMANNAVDPYVLGAWIIMCQNTADSQKIYPQFDVLQIDQLINEIKCIMRNPNTNIQKELNENCFAIDENFYENISLLNDELLEKYLNQQMKQEDIQKVISLRQMFPVFFGSALKDEGVEEFMEALDLYTCQKL